MCLMPSIKCTSAAKIRYSTCKREAQSPKYRKASQKPATRMLPLGSWDSVGGPGTGRRTPKIARFTNFTKVASWSQVEFWQERHANQTAPAPSCISHSHRRTTRTVWRLRHLAPAPDKSLPTPVFRPDFFSALEKHPPLPVAPLEPRPVTRMRGVGRRQLPS